MTETTLLSNKSSGLYNDGSPLKALAAETCIISFSSITINDFSILFSARGVGSLLMKFNFALKKMFKTHRDYFAFKE
jgi:hypothetical protein